MTTYGQWCTAQLTELCRATGLAPSARQILEVQSFLMEAWGGREVPQLAPYPSRIGDDHSPYEYSLQFSRAAVELRLLLEAQAANPALYSNQLAARALNSRLAARFNLDFSRFAQLQDLFCPEDPQGPFSIWHAVCFDRAGHPDFKLYLNPQVHAGVSAATLVTEALERLGLARVASPVIDRVSALGGRPNYFSLDLSARLGSRVKLYFSHEAASMATLEAIFALSPASRAGDVTRFCQEMLGDRAELDRKPVCYCFSFVSGEPAPVAVTFHLPVADYVASDALICTRISAFMAREGLAVSTYREALGALARRDLDAHAGLQSYASFRRERSGIKFTVYLSPELFSMPVAQSSAREPSNRCLDSGK